jgi:hypothetical protein
MLIESDSLIINNSGRPIADNAVFNLMDYCALQISRGGCSFFYPNYFSNINCIKNSAFGRKGDVTLLLTHQNLKIFYKL